MSSTTSTPNSVILDDITFAWPDGTRVLDQLTAALPAGRTGMIGANGTGKSTLLRVIAGLASPASGHLCVPGRVGYLPQRLSLDVDATVADLLGVRGILDALTAIEHGSADPSDFDMVGEDWDISERCLADLTSAGLGEVDASDLTRRVGTLSGGQAMLIALVGLWRTRHEVVLLDEPTNSLDRKAREHLHGALAEHTSWAPTLIVASHDVELLDLMDQTVELLHGSLSVFGGPYSAYREHLARQQSAADQALSTAEQTLKREERQRTAAQTTLARRRSYARKDFANKRRPKAIMNNRRQEAQVSAGKLRTELDRKVDAAQLRVDTHAAEIRDDEHVRITLPDPNVPAGRLIAELPLTTGRHVLQGPERLALTGANGCGKTRMLEDLLAGRRGLLHTDRVGYLPQRGNHLEEDATVIDCVRSAAPHAEPQQVRADLARFLFSGETVHRRVGDLSGGERFRVALASVLMTTPPNQLLILDEPTNDIDLPTVDALVDALDAYTGALIVVSHDEDLLRRLRAHRVQR